MIRKTEDPSAEDTRILEVLGGSHLHGTTTPESDKDFFGVFMPTDEYVFGLSRTDEASYDVVAKDDDGKNTKDAVDRKLYEYRKFCRLALDNNPNILSILFAGDKNVIFENEYGKRLRENKHLFLWQGLHRGYKGYASAQKHKMRIKPINYKELVEAYEYLETQHDKDVLAGIYEKDPMARDAFKKIESNPEKRKFLRAGDLTFEAAWYVKKVRKMIKHRLDAATNRSNLFTKFGYDCIFGCHLIRLLCEGIEFLETGTIVYPNQHRDLILDIKLGNWEVEKVLELAEILEQRCDEALMYTTLPAKPQKYKVENFVIQEVKAFSVGGALK